MSETIAHARAELERMRQKLSENVFNSQIEEALDQMMRSDLSPVQTRHWASKADALLILDQLRIADRNRRRDAFHASIIFKTFDPVAKEELRRRAGVARKRAEVLLAR